ncbi:undecaprenyl-diphosphate phosphatase [Candidatus Solirubrobacter pratensis]|uniref:undecaprenyl-diphosphate phosphatase n=1 Tax=Candidatus Solirubrobacter pratensis TaxID=1298857 RepID=UPI0009DBC3C8|nr:undecaprenyl-diphosphate phosphatase [Candidatus Solirubrobacter pratensis]
MPPPALKGPSKNPGAPDLLRRTLEAAALGLIQGAAELLPVSSSAHVAMIPWLLGWEVAAWPPARRKELEVALHCGAGLALAPALWRGRPDLRTLALSLAPPVIAGYLLEERIQTRLGGPAAIAGGLLAGALALAAADLKASEGFKSPSAADGLALGLAQAVALAPGVSRTGATLAAARARGFAREEASALSFGVAGPVLVGATALKAWRLRAAPRGHRGPAAIAALSAFAATAAAVRVLGTRRTRPLWPYAAERAALAGGILAVRYRRAK